MYLPDVNVWVALAFPSHAHHRAARVWFDGTPPDRRCHFCRVSQMGFLRIVNNNRALPQAAVRQDQAWTIYDHFLTHPQVAFAHEPAGIEAHWRGWTNLPRFATNVWNDASSAGVIA